LSSKMSTTETLESGVFIGFPSLFVLFCFFYIKMFYLRLSFVELEDEHDQNLGVGSVYWLSITFCSFFIFIF